MAFEFGRHGGGFVHLGGGEEEQTFIAGSGHDDGAFLAAFEGGFQGIQT
jgi:hypothetical protein